MACQIKYDFEKGGYSVTAPNGQESILFETIKSLPEIENESQAMRSWIKIYTKPFKEWFGMDWETLSPAERDSLIKQGFLDENGEPIIAYRGDYANLESFNYSDAVGKFGQGIYLAQNRSQAESFAQKTGKKVYPVFIKPGAVIEFKNNLEFLQTVADFNKIKTPPTQEHVKNYVDAMHNEGVTIVGRGVMGKEFNVPSKNNVKSIFTKGFDLTSGVLFDNSTVSRKFMTEEFQMKRKSDQFVEEAIMRLADNLGMDYGSEVKFITRDEAALVTKDSKNPWSGQPAFFYQGKVYFVKENITYDTAFHEFAHPFVRGLSKDNTKLFERVFQDIINTDEGAQFLAEAMEEYPELDTSHNQIKEEVIVKAMTAAANTDKLADKAQQPSSKLMAAIQKLIYALKQMFRKISGKSKLSKISETATVKELADMMIDQTWEVNLDYTTEDDVVAYMNELDKVAKDLMKFHESAEGRQKLAQLARDNVQIAIRQMEEMKESGQYEDLKIILSDKGNTPFEKMLKNLAAFKDKASVDRAFSERINELEEFTRRANALTFNLDTMEFLVKKMKSHIKDLVDEPNQKKALGQLSFFTNSLQQWEQYLDNFLKEAETQGIRTEDSALVDGIVKLKEDIRRGKDDIYTIYQNATRDALYEIWAPMEENLKKSTDARIKKLKEEQKKHDPSSKRYKTIEYEINEEKRRASKAINKEDLLNYITGKMGDIGTLHAWLESYTSNQDPSISSLSMFIKKHMSEVQTETHQGYNEFVTKLSPILKELGVSPSKINKFSEKFLFEDRSYKRNEETGELEEFKVFTFLNEFKDYKFALASMDEAIKKAEVAFEGNPTEENRQAFINAVNSKQDHIKYFFNKQYVDKFYHADDILDKTEVGRKAKQLRDTKLSEIEFYQRTHADESELYEDYETLDVLWREYKQLYSLYDEYGEMKEGEELEMAKALKEHREAKRKFYKYTLNEDSFNTAYRHFLLKEKLRLEQEGDYPVNSKQFQEELDRRKKAWLERNTQVRISDDFYVARNNIMEKIQSIMDEIGGSDFSAEWEVILDSMQGRKDTNGQPIGSEMTEEHLSKIKAIEEQMEVAKLDVAGASGLSPNEWARMNYFYDKMNNDERLTKQELVEYRKLKNKKSKQGLPKAKKERLAALFRALENLQEKKATDYYIDIVNEHYRDIMKEQGEENPMLIDYDNVDSFMEPSFVEPLLEKSEKFKKWFMNNHIKKQKFDKEAGAILEKYHRTYAWSVIRPKDERYLEKTQVKDETGKVIETITGVPAMKYHRREVKDEFKTGYNPQTGEVKLEVGKHVNAKGQWLPKSLEEMEKVKDQYADELAQQPYAYDQYINYDYLNLKKQGGAEFKALEFLKEFHLKHQETLEKNGKLGLELPRYRRDLYEYVTNTDTSSIKDKWGSLVEGWTQLWAKRKDDDQDGLNYDEQMSMVEIDKYSGESGRVPVTGRYIIDTDQVSRDITSSLMMYYQSSAMNKKLREIQPIARAMQKLAHDNNPLDLKKMQKLTYEQRMASGPIYSKTNNRAKVIDSVVETIFEGKKLFESSNKPVTIKIINNALGMASHAFFAFDVTSAMKNFLGAQFQIALEGAGNKYFNYKDWQLGRPWANKTMWEISGQIYSTEAKSKNVQLVEVFDAIQGRFEEKFGESISRSFMRDAANLTWTTSHRKWLETEATLQLFSAIMHSTKVEQTIDGKTKKIKYIDAWEIDPETNTVKLKEGIDKSWDINGENFNRVKFKNHEVSNLLQGAYADFDQPMVNRHILWRLVSSMRKYFTKMFLHRYGHSGSFLNPEERYNLPTNDMHMGFYMRNISWIRKMIDTRGGHLMYTTKEEMRAMKMGLLEIAKIQLLTLAYMWLWGWDEDDPDKWKKRKGEMSTGAFFEGSGALPWFGLTDEEWTENFNVRGWMGNQLLLLAMHVEAENEHFIPWPGYGLKDLASLFTESSVASGPSIGTLLTFFYDIVYTMEGEDSVIYKKDTGALTTQQEGRNKFWRHFQKMWGIKGKWEDPVTSLKNFKGARDNYSSL